MIGRNGHSCEPMKGLLILMVSIDVQGIDGDDYYKT